MEKVVKDYEILFYDNDKLVMSMGYQFDEFVWAFYDKIMVTKEDELYEPLCYIMSQNYQFVNDDLECSKTDDKLVWYSDCYYNPDDQFSIMNVSYLTIERHEDCFNLYCTKPLDKILGKLDSNYVIVFSPAGNGKYARNIDKSTNLQDDIIINVYQSLLHKKLIRKK